MGDTGRWTAAGQHLDLQQRGGEDQLILRKRTSKVNSHKHCINLLLCENTIPNVKLADGAYKGFNGVEAFTPLILVLA